MILAQTRGRRHMVTTDGPDAPTVRIHLVATAHQVDSEGHIFAEIPRFAWDELVASIGQCEREGHRWVPVTHWGAEGCLVCRMPRPVAP